jgi:two-component system sensor histidine kinase/response regulator
MPVLNGVDACRILRDRGVQVPIIALTGNALAEDVDAFMSAGAVAVLTKPINRAQLQQALAEHLPAHINATKELARIQSRQSRSLEHT